MAVLKKISWQAILFIFLAVFLARNLLLPIIADDYSYAFIWDGAGLGNLMDGMDSSRLQRVQSFSDILYSQWSHYFTWGGRTIAHIFVQFFVLHGRIFFDVVNIFVMAAFIFLLFKAATGYNLREMKKIYLLWILAALYFCAPSFAITTVWLTGACNYLWMCTLEILFLLPFALKYWRKDFWADSTRGKVILMAILGLMAGWSIEPGGAVTVFVAFLFCANFYRERNLQPWMKAGFAFLLIGFALLMLAPGNVHRLELTNALEPSALIPPENQWAAQMFLVNFATGFLPVFVRELILFAPIIFYFAKARTSEKVSRFIAGFSAAAILVLCIMMFSPEFPERAGFPSTILLIIASTAALKEILPQLQKICSRREKIFNLAGNIFVAVWILSMAGCLYVENDLSNQLSARMKIIDEHRGENLIVVPPLEIPTWSETFLGTRTWDEMTLRWGGDLEANPKGNRDILFAKYHGLKQIKTSERPE